MTEETVVENGNGTPQPNVEEQTAKTKEDVKAAAESVKKSATQVSSTAKDTINEAFKQVEKQMGSISQALGSALQDRANVVMVRVNDDSLHYLDVLVEADITKSRSESAAFLINEGIKANQGLFDKIGEITDQISALKAQLRESVKLE
jgi:uncharacterized FlaG/YvyC family protein